MAEQLHHQRLVDPMIVLKDLTSLELKALHSFEMLCYVMLCYPPHSVVSQKTRVFSFDSSWNLPNDCIIKVWLCADNHCQEFEL